MTTKNIGLFGLGCVGYGLYQLLQSTSPSAGLTIKRIAVSDRRKPRLVPSELITFRPEAIIANPDIDLVVEAIDDADAAWAIVRNALLQGKPVVTANKKMVAEHLGELLMLQKKTGVPVLYEAAVCGAIPIVRTVDQYFSQEPIQHITGIFNGTSNYILSKIFNERIEYPLALRQAQKLGFAEADPTADVGGFDPKYKLIIIALHAHGIVLSPAAVFSSGIDRLTQADIRYAREKGWKIRLVPELMRTEEGVTAFVMPRFVKPSEPLFPIEYERNAVSVTPAFSGEQFFSGKGAGAFPTAAAVLGDLRAVASGHGYSYARMNAPVPTLPDERVLIDIYLRYAHFNQVKQLGFERVTSGLMEGDFQYVTGTVTLARLKRCAHALQREGAMVIGTGSVRISGT
ncbi:MAG TPA: homoserine dehydrogenase [Saprospirales bacterium]|nr:homoserine dehydrogenase [Saprospirales bacterium]